jgi:acyl-CoA reductase-like NAD-dependent aldehyde dehydrogenase
VRRLIDIGVAEGARLTAGGGIPQLPAPLDNGFYLEPTVLAGATNGMRVSQEEIFGPVAVVVPFDTEREAVAMANDNRFALGAGVWTRNLARGHRVADGITAGMVWVNDHHRLEPSLPWGGVKESGTGKDAGTESFDDFTWIKTVVVRTAEDDVDWYGQTDPGRLN